MEERIRAGLRLPYELNIWLTKAAKQQGISKNAFILKILWAWKEKNKD